MSDHVGRQAAARTAEAARVNGSDGCGSGGDGGDGESEGGSGDGGFAVRAFWGRLGVPGLVDVHTHFMPERVLNKVWEYFDSAGELVGGVEWPITYREDEAERVRLLREEFGVLAFTSMIYPHKARMAEWLNGWSVGFAARTPGCLHTSTFFPEPGAAGYVRDALDAGARIFKSHVQVGGYDPGDPLLDPVWGLLAEAEVPVVIHCGSGPAPGKFTGPGPVGRVLARHPRLRLVVAHMGMPEYADFLGLAETYGEVRLDTTMAFTDFSERSAPFPAGGLGRLRDLGDRVLFGSDFPNIPYPYLHQLEALERLGLGDEWLRAVCHDNAARLFGLPVRRPLPDPGPLPG
ncbi:amidohydrolase [Streptomyces xanthochromogenes]|uniref:amidohydrolase family protein n=1 Tax=Streptomyces xanthochromogenes TaxID=67384 RepID=UPI001672AAB0|nr:amidohydrolase family protein [Streptomyces xanthochromogenes]GHB58818.1 amidohydrolase [Streptomyces xanthochromogenes]